MSLVTASFSFTQAIRCDMTQYRESKGLTAYVEKDLLVVNWTGQDAAELRARFAIDHGQPVVRDLAIREKGGQWAILGQNLIPEYNVVSGIRRGEGGKKLEASADFKFSKEVIDNQRWLEFHDAPLDIPGAREKIPRKPDEVRRMDATFSSTGCSVKTDGARLEVTFPGLSMGIFSGSLQFTVYRSTNLIRMDAVAKTDEQWVAYKYDAGLNGFSTDSMERVYWQDTGGNPQQYQFGGVVNDTRVRLKADNRVLVAEGKGGSLATFPMPHKFFWAREIHINNGYVWYRKDSEKEFGMGVRQSENEGSTVPLYQDCYALYSARPGTWQRMGMYFYASLDAAEPTREAVLAFTHGDVYKPLPGFKTFTNHWHLREDNVTTAFTERVMKTGSFDTPLQDIVAMKALGLNIVGISDFHGDMNANDPGPLRFQDQKNYGEACRRASDKDFLVLPWEEPNFYVGGHINIMFPKNVYFSRVREPGQPFTEIDPVYGRVYHIGSLDDLQKLLDAEDGYWNTAHPRTKSSVGYPDLCWDKPIAKNDRYLGVDFTQAMDVDLSKKRMSEWRSFDAVDQMNNMYANSGLLPKGFLTDIDTYKQGPEDDLYPGYQVVYLKLDQVPGPDEDWSPILQAIRNSDYFITTGEILISNYAVEGSGNQRTITADVEWTFPLEFVEVVWGDGQNVDRQVISATDLPAFGSKRFSIPFDASGKSWVRFAVWDSAGNPAFVNAVWLFHATVFKPGIPGGIESTG
jgi:hypothetical protein